jgi:adenylate kinase family enzyme
LSDVRAPYRITIAGTTGAGKTTLAAALGARLGIRHVEMDALAHGPNWTRRPEFEDDVRAFVAGEEWVTEWGYSQVRAMVIERATLLVWLDYPLMLRLSRNVRRTVRRRMRREVLWSGNIEPPLWTFFTDPDHIIRWAWRTRNKHEGLPATIAAMGRPDLPIVRLRSQAATDAWLVTI